MRIYIACGVLLFFSVDFLMAQNHGEFKGQSFPSHLISGSIIEQRGLEPQMKMLKEQCNWSTRVGKKVDVFWMSNTEGNLFGHVYEYFMDCDNIRLIYWYADPNGRGIILDFMIEPLEEDSQFVSSTKKHLKNKKKYQVYLKPH